MNTFENNPEKKADCGQNTCCRPHRFCHMVKTILLVLVFLMQIGLVCYLPKLIRAEVTKQEAIKVGGMENLNKINNELYQTAEFKDAMKKQLPKLIEMQKMQIQMAQQALEAEQNASATGGEEAVPASSGAINTEVPSDK